MVNTLQKIYNKTPWQQRRLSQPLSDPNYMPTTLQHSTVYEEEIPDHHDHQPADADTDPDPADQTQLRRQVSIAEPALTRSSTQRHIHDKSNSSSGGGNGAGSDSNQQPLRRGMTRADTKISLRKSNKDSRRVFVNIPPPAQYLDKSGAPKLSYGSNRINTAKYTTLTFLPKNLFEQFRRVANMFFLFMAIIQLTPIFTVGSPFLTVFPLCFVVGVTAIKDGFEDYKRHVEDRNFNQRLCLQLKNVVNYNYPTAGLRAAQKDMGIFARVWSTLTHGLSTGTKKSMRALKLAKKPSRDLPQMDLNDLAPMDDDDPSQQQNGDGVDAAKAGPQPEFIKEQWHNLRVGDFIMLKNNQAVPADAIILSTSETEGSCFIETKDLDGETNLKTRVSLHETSKYNTARRCSRLKCFVDMEPINANLFSFSGSLTMLARKRHADPNAGPSANNRYSHYAPSVTSSMMSSPRASMDENDWAREPLEGQHHGEGTTDPQQPAQSGTSASDYARLHKSASHRRRSRFSESLDASSSHPADMSLSNNNGGDKEEYQGSENMSHQDDPSSLRATKSKRSSLHRSATGASMGGASEMVKNVLKANHEQQMQQQQQQQHPNGAIRRGLSVSTNNPNSPYKETTIPVDINNMLLRGHVIRNTHWVIAVIVATGTETKIMLNSGETPSKRSRIEKTMNIQNIIPISLYISIEFVKTFQAYFIWQDTDMYDVELDQFCTPKTWNLTDDLGQIEYVFSDKTGTLTRNIMEFKKCSINGKIYGNNAVSGQTDAEMGLQMMNEGGESGAQPTDSQRQQDEKKAVLEEFDREVRGLFDPTFMDPLEILTFADPALLQDLTGASSSENKSTSAGEGSSTSIQQRDARSSGSSGQLGAPTHDGSPASNIRDFFTLLALCHTVVVEQPEEAVEDDEDDDFGIYEDNGSPTSKQSGDDSSETSPEQKTSRFGLRDKLKRKAEAAGLSVPGTASNVSGNRSRKNSSATVAPPGVKSAAGANGSGGSLDEQGKPKPTICYRAESPDEAALVSAAKNVGFAFVSRGAAAGAESTGGAKAGGNSRQNVNLNVLGQDYTYEQLDVIKFNSTRKRMTVIVREPQELGGRILLLTKGADNVIFERLSHETKDDALRDQTEQDIEAFSNMGLRTLTLAQRILDQQTYDTWAEKYAAAGKALDERAKKMDQVAEEIEKDLTLLGATAIEDKLQEGVPDSIAALREAGIKVWVLTGDKLETAINIGFASRLLEKEMKLEIMKMGRNEKPEQVLKRFKQLVEGVLSGRGSEEEQDAATFTTPSGDKEEVEDHQSQEQSAPHPAEPNSAEQGRLWHDKSLPPTPAGTQFEDPMSAAQHVQHALIVDGSALKILLDDPDARKDLIKLSDVCFSVICCRASPLQKALVVELIRRGKKTVCLAIGDGANDVSMIQAANIGVGIAGQEGMQAAMASDYSITQFRFIRKLVIVHGHWGYMRIAEMILNFFFKNVLWVGAVLWFQIYCGFSAMLFYDYTFVSLYNLMFTAVPVLVLGATDQDLTAPYILRYPGVYRLGIQQKRYNQYRFVAYMLDGVWQSLIVFWFWRAVYGINVLGRNGIDSSLLEFSTSVAMTNIVIASLYLGLHTYHWTWLMHFAVWGSIVFMLLLVLIYGAVTTSPIYHVAIRLFSLGPFWLMLILSVVCAFMVRYTVLFISFWWFPDDVHAARGIMIAEKRIAQALKVRWTGLAPDGMAPDEQTEQEKAILKKEDIKREAKEAAKAEKKAAKNGGKGRGESDEQPYDLTMIQINVNDHSPNAAQNQQDLNQSNRSPTPLEIQQQLLRAQQQQFQHMATPDGHTLKPDDPSFQHSRRTSSYNYINTLQDKPAALPPVPSPSLPSLPSYSAGSSKTSLHAPPPPGAAE
ncbi:hypothetical protein BGZ72_003804 [Mortierella alpina]|nr:hypothetical protein BGZ72_003804 [Mortierella alpina]